MHHLEKFKTILKAPVGLNEQLVQHHKHKGIGSEPWMESMMLSPCATHVTDENGVSISFSCCSECCGALKQHGHKKTIPRFATANGFHIGESPPELSCLNEVELALVSHARVNSHIFTFYGGAHKSIRGWHTLFDGRVDHVASTLQQLPSLNVNNVIACILCGPFTNVKCMKIKEQVMVRSHLNIRAIMWLKENNKLYKDVEIPNAEDLPTPIIVDNQEGTEESEDATTENKIDVTVLFPDTKELNAVNAGLENINEL